MCMENLESLSYEDYLSWPPMLKKKLQTKLDMFNPRLGRIELFRKTGRTQDLIEAVIKDEKGNHIVLEELHLRWHSFIEEQFAKGKSCVGILAPWGHGKTVGLVLGYPLAYLAKDQSLRIKIICNSDANAQSRVSTLKKYVEFDSDYALATRGLVVPMKNQTWTEHSFIIKRMSFTIDPTVEAKGILVGGIGGRADFLIIDDPCDMQNSVVSRTVRDKVKDVFYNVWMSRLTPNAKTILIGTAWHERDLVHELLESPEWAFLIQRINKEKTYIEEIRVNSL